MPLDRSVASIINCLYCSHWRSQDFVLRGLKNRGAEFETPKASSGEGNGERVSPSPADYRESGERRKPKTDFVAF